MSNQPNAGPIPVSASDAPNVAKKWKPKPKSKNKSASKPIKILPTARLTVSKQLDILRAYAAASGKGAKPATTEDAAEIVKMSPTTVIMANAFLSSVGLLRRVGKGSYMPSAEVLEFAGPAYEWDRKTASYKLAPRLRETWFGQALLPRISFEDIDEKTALGVLGETVKAGPDYENELRILLDFLVVGGVAQRDGTQIKLMKLPSDVSGTQPRTEERADTDNARGKAPRVGIDTAYAAQAPGGGVDFRINVHVDMAEFGTWQPQRISAFFKGIAEVLAAKADVEKGGVGS